MPLDTGMYNVERCGGEGYRVIDTGKEREYILETSRMGELADLPEERLFIWVLDPNNVEGDALGYILDGWVFLRKT